MIVLHFFLISLGLVSREEEKEEPEQAGSEENDQQAHRKRRETFGDENRKNKLLDAPQRSFLLFGKMTCHCLSVTH